MKKIKLVLVAMTLFIGATSFVNAQSKIAHIDTGALVEAMKINGFKRYIEFIDSLDSLPAYSGDYTIEHLKKILNVLESFESEGFKPINGKKYKELWDSQTT